jgi:hypothetical protein
MANLIEDQDNTVMKTVEVSVTVNADGQLKLDHPLSLAQGSRVRLTVLIEEERENDPDDEPNSLILESLRQALTEVKQGKTIPLLQLWEGVDVE